ncbi:MAG: hypothetical protein P8X68_09295 [Desulfobacterales bacterium]
MANRNKDEKLDSEIAKRLDDLFGEGDSSSDEGSDPTADEADEAENKSQTQNRTAAAEEVFELEDLVVNEKPKEPAAAEHPLAVLKSMVLSIDWEITDEVLSDFLSQIANLKKAYKNEKIILMFLQLLGSLGEYIKTNRGKAHPKTFKVLNSVFSRLEDIVSTEGLTESEKIKILRIEMDKYKQLRSQVSKKKAAEVHKGKAKPLHEDKPDESALKKKPMDIGPDRAFTIAAGKKRIPDSAAAKRATTLVEAIEELKQYIHSELSALRQEIKRIQKSK